MKQFLTIAGIVAAPDNTPVNYTPRPLGAIIRRGRKYRVYVIEGAMYLHVASTKKWFLSAAIGV